MFEKISAFSEDRGLDMKYACDGWSSTHGSEVSSLAAPWLVVAPQMITSHCTVHQTALCK